MFWEIKFSLYFRQVINPSFSGRGKKKKSTRNALSINISYPLVNEVFLTWICWLGVSSDCQPQPDLILSEVCPWALNGRLYPLPSAWWGLRRLSAGLLSTFPLCWVNSGLGL